MSLIQTIHGGYVHKRRVRVLAEALVQALPQNARVLDIGCGDGLLAQLIQQRRPDITIEGVDVLVRDQTHIPVKAFDGMTLPFGVGTFDVAMFVDVLHHTDDPMVLLREACRVATRGIVLKDHTRNGMLAGQTLRFMDWVGNARHGVRLPYNYWPKRRWNEAFDALGLQIEQWNARLGLYPFPAKLVFERRLHFVARLGKKSKTP